MAERLIALGVIARAHGLAGEMRVKLWNPGSDLFFEQKRVTLRREGEIREARIRSARPERDAALLRLDGVNDRNAAEAMRGFEICIPRDALPKLDEGEVYLIDLVGLRAELPDGTVAGEVAEVLEYPASTCLLVRGPEGDREVPMAEPYLIAVDLPAGRVIVDRLGDLDPPAKR